MSQVFVAVEPCGCVFAGDADGGNVAEWKRLGYHIETREGPVSIPQPCAAHRKASTRIREIAHERRHGQPTPGITGRTVEQCRVDCINAYQNLSTVWPDAIMQYLDELQSANGKSLNSFPNPEKSTNA